MGRLSHYFDMPVEEWMAAIEKIVPPRFLEINRRAFDLGRNA
jgi:indolepyruvate ferredoxin oxidoreductase beta subunit